MSSDRTDEDFMRVALKGAIISLGQRVLPIGAVVVLRNEIIGFDFKTRDKNPRLDHAEIGALRQALNGGTKWADQMTIFTTLEPCSQCFFTALNCRVGRIIYAMEDPFDGMSYYLNTELSPRHRSHKTIITGGVLREESRKLLQMFFFTTDDKFWKNEENPLVSACLCENR